MPSGGARPNTGPKKGTKHKKTLEREAQREAYNRIVDEHWDDILLVHMEQAKKPDSVIERKYVMDQRIGKAKDTVDVNMQPDFLFLKKDDGQDKA